MGEVKRGQVTGEATSGEGSRARQDFCPSKHEEKNFTSKSRQARFLSD